MTADTPTPTPGAAPAQGLPSVAIAVLTYHRPEHASVIVDVLDAAADEVADGRAIRVVVVDNDPEGGAREAIERQAATARHAVSYVHEPEPGIAAARNAALTACTEDALVFIDDDERPAPGWLPALIGQWEATGADAVGGPVDSDFEVAPEPWLVAGRWFLHERHETGYAMGAAATNNLLLDMRTVRRLGLSFDASFGLSGGEDTMLTKTLVREGGRITWCAEAVVVDHVPASRTTRDWVKRRAYRSGNTSSAVEIALAAQDGRAGRARARQGVKGLERLLAGAAGIAASGLRRGESRTAASARSWRMLERGRGMLAGAIGSRYQEYRRG